MKLNKFFIYNLRQANYFFARGLMPLLVDKGRKGDTYLEFERNEQSEKVFRDWCNLCKESREKQLSKSDKRISHLIDEVLITA